MEEPQELELLPSLSLMNQRSSRKKKIDDEGPWLELQLSMIRPDGVEALKWQAAEQMRMATLDKAYAARLRELTRREMDLAHSEFARARHVWERAHREVETAQTRIPIHHDEITCHSCLQRFRP